MVSERHGRTSLGEWLHCRVQGALQELVLGGDVSGSLANFGFNYLLLCLHAGGRGISPSLSAP